MVCDQSNIPEEFLCPLTLEIMVDPIMNREGHSYERSAIVTWLNTNTTCPLTRKPMRISDFISNRLLQSKIQSWRISQGDDPTEVTDESETCYEQELSKVYVSCPVYKRRRPLRRLLRNLRRVA